ncbi:MAG: tetratricopeptide repeat protein [Anaerolineae bacterium]|nr:MAG: tetratricopeptide repeat protein [Anaerolineae bacterium]
MTAACHRHRGLFKTAEGYAREAVASFRRLDHEYRLADALQGLAHVAILRGNLGEARACLEEALDIATGMDDKFTVAIVEKTFGQIYLRQDRLDEAQVAFERYLKAMTDVGQELRVAMAHHHLGEVFQRRGDWAGAKAHFRAASRCIYGQTSAAFRAVETLRLFGLVAVGQGRRSGECQLLRFALKQAELHELFHVQAWTHLSLAQTLLDGPGSDRQAVERHLDAAGALAAEQEYRNIAQQAARLREALQAQGDLGDGAGWDADERGKKQRSVSLEQFSSIYEELESG